MVIFFFPIRTFCSHSFISSFSPLPVPNSLSGLRQTDRRQEEKQGCNSQKNGVRGLDVGYGGVGGRGKALISVKLTTFIPRILLSPSMNRAVCTVWLSKKTKIYWHLQGRNLILLKGQVRSNICIPHFIEIFVPNRKVRTKTSFIFFLFNMQAVLLHQLVELLVD